MTVYAFDDVGLLATMPETVAAKAVARGEAVRTDRPDVIVLRPDAVERFAPEGPSARERRRQYVAKHGKRAA